MHCLLLVKDGSGGRGASLFPVSKQKCLSCCCCLMQLTLPDCLFPRSVNLCTSFTQVSAQMPPLRKLPLSLSSKSTVSMAYLILFTTLTNWIIISQLFISPNIMSTPWDQRPWLSFTTICPYSLTQCLGHNNYVHISWTFKDCWLLKRTNPLLWNMHIQVESRYPVSGWFLFSLEYGICGFKQWACDGPCYLDSFSLQKWVDFYGTH